MTLRRKFQIKLPLRMKVNKAGDQESLNLNVFRNLHFYKLNHQKKAFQVFVKPLLSGIPPMETIRLEYQLNPKGGHRLDMMNVGSIVDKFFSDALVENGIIPDDDYKHLDKATFSFGRLCPEDPHVLVTIIETKPRKETHMRILLDQEEIRQALEAFVQTMGLPGAAGVELTVNEDGEVEAEIMTNLRLIKAPTHAYPTSDESGDEDQSVTSSDEPPRRKRGGRVPGSKNKPKVSTDVQATASGGSSGASEGAGDGAVGKADLFSEDGDESDEDDGIEVGDLDISGDSSDSSGDEGEEEDDDLFSTDGSSPRGNHSGDSDSGSSEDPTTEDDESGEEETSAPAVKRPSIFDAD
jgi:hypothetical protein